MIRRASRSSKAFIIIRNLIITEAIVYGAFLLVALSAHWALLYRQNFAISKYISFTVLEFGFLALVQAVVVTVVVTRSLKEDRDVKELISAGENGNLEFKTSLRWDVKRNQVNKDLERGIFKTITAFLNSEGGHLVIGVDDNRQVVGLEPDLNTLAKKNKDGFENHFNNLFISLIGSEFRRFVRLTFNEVDSKLVCLVTVKPSDKPAYLKAPEGEFFFVRTGNATTPLKMSEVATYISTWWQR